MRTEDHLWSRIVRQPNGCNEWTGPTIRGGYGRTYIKGVSTLVHRLVWELASGVPIPAGKVIMHTCDNPPCCEVTHLQLGTQADNVADMMVKGRWRSGMGDHNVAKTHCPDNHAYDEENTYVSLDGKRHCRACGRERYALKCGKMGSACKC